MFLIKWFVDQMFFFYIHFRHFEKWFVYFLIKQIYINITADYFVDFAQSQIRQLSVFLITAQTIEWIELSLFLQHAIKILDEIIIKLINNSKNIISKDNNIYIDTDIDIDKITFKILWENDVVNLIRKLYTNYLQTYNSI